VTTGAPLYDLLLMCVSAIRYVASVFFAVRLRHFLLTDALNLVLCRLLDRIWTGSSW